MEESLISTSISYIQTNWWAVLGRLFWWIAAFIAMYIIIKYIIQRVKTKMEGDSLIADAYAQKNSKLVGRVIFIVLMIFNVLSTFEIIGFDVAIIMWGISLSIWFAMETTIGNLISWVFILTNKKIKLGDYAEFLGQLKIRGVIEEVNVRYTVVRSFDKRRIIIPNSIVAKTPIRTLKSEPLLKGEVKFTIPRNIPFELIKTIFSQIIKSNQKILYPEYSSIMIENFDSTGIHLKWFFFSNPAKKLPVMIAREIRWLLFEELKRRWIEIPYKHITVATE